MRHRTRLGLALLALLAVLAPVSCQRAARESVPASEAMQQAEAPAPPGGNLAAMGAAQPGSADAAKPAGPRVTDQARKLVKTVDIELRVADTTKSAEKVRQLAGQLGGFVSGLSAQRRDDLLYYSITLRVPVDQLEEALRRVKTLAKRVESESVRTEDVTDKWVDLDARLTTLRATETELRQLLTEARQQQQKVSAVMEVYEKLTEIRTSIEQIEGAKRALEGLASLSTINVSLVPTEAAKPILAESWSAGSTLRRSFRTLVSALQWLADVAIVLGVVAVPLLLLVVLPFWVLVRLWRWSRRRASERQG
jgi:hypothetical protein